MKRIKNRSPEWGVPLSEQKNERKKKKKPKFKYWFVRLFLIFFISSLSFFFFFFFSIPVHITTYVHISASCSHIDRPFLLWLGSKGDRQGHPHTRYKNEIQSKKGKKKKIRLMYTPPPTPSSLCALLWSTNTQEMLPLVTMLGPQRSQRPIYLYVPVHWMTTVCVVGNEFNPKVWCSSLAEDEWNEPTSRSNFHYQKKVKKKTEK